MPQITSRIPRSPLKASPFKAASRCARWPVSLLAAAALLTACGGSDAPDVAAGAPVAMANAPAPEPAKPDAAAPNATAPGAPQELPPAKPLAANCDAQANDTDEQLLECVTLAGVRAHQTELMNIAKAHNGTRLAGTPGHEASLEYVKKVLTEAGYRVTVQSFEFPVSRVEASSLRMPGQMAGAAIPHLVLDYSGSADITASVTPAAGPAGCAAADFAGFPSGHIALVRRGGCELTDKVQAAVAAGAAGVVIYNHDDGPLTGSLTAQAPLDVPVVLVSKSVGEQLQQRPLIGAPLQLRTQTSRSMGTTHNLLAESTSGDPEHVTMAGAHLDSVRAGAGINDNGSGVAALLETARQMARVKPRNLLRFAFWSAEEQGLIGSTHYVRTLPAAERAKLGLYLNFDMIGSPNHVFEVYGGDGSAGKKAISSPLLSAKIVDFLAEFYTARKLASKRVNSGGRSDHKPFADIGVPFGGVFTGAEEIKTAQDAKEWGGTAGQAYDPCYHRACDNLENVNETALDINADLVAHAVLYYAMQPLTP